MTDYISREELIKHFCNECDGYCECIECDCLSCKSEHRCEMVQEIDAFPAADVREVIFCKDCKHNNACLTQAFIEDASRMPFDRNTFFCADGKREEQT